jgi:DNA-directed RNA polymerase subunit L
LFIAGFSDKKRKDNNEEEYKDMENVKLSLNGMRMDAEVKDVPIGFVNALRRILLAEIPTVVLTNIQILDNTTQMTHEMLRHRMEMLPVNVRAEEAGVIRDTKLELKFVASPEPREVTSRDFVVTGPRTDILLQDRDLGTDLYFMTLKPNETLHIKATLAIETKGASQVCVSTFKNHIDEDQAMADRDLFMTDAINKLPPELRETLSDAQVKLMQEEAARIFNSFHIQRSFHKGPDGRADWFDFTVESIGVTPAKDLFKKAVDILQTKVNEWVKNPILREEGGWYRIETAVEGFTLGQFAQEMMYKSAIADFVSRDVGHPLVPKLVIRFHTTAQPETVISDFQKAAVSLCETILGSV